MDRMEGFELDELEPGWTVDRNDEAGTGMGANILAAFFAFLLAPGIPIPERKIDHVASLFLD